MCSEKKRLANQRNALKSTGPKTAEGKARSRRNALKHGLAGTGVVLPPEDRALFEQRLQSWTHAERPEGEVESYYLACAVLATVRIDRCARKELGDIARRRRQAVGTWEALQRKRVETLAEQLETEPEPAARDLEAFSHGCRWLIDQWDELAEALDEGETPACWTADHTARAEELLGYRPAEPAREQDADGLIDMLRQHAPGAEQGEPIALAALLDLCLDEMERLGEQHNLHLAGDEGRKLAEMVDRVCFDSTATGTLLRRYESASKLELHRMMGDLDRHRKNRRSPLADSGVAPPAARGLLATPTPSSPGIQPPTAEPGAAEAAPDPQAGPVEAPEAPAAPEAAIEPAAPVPGSAPAEPQGEAARIEPTPAAATTTPEATSAEPPAPANPPAAGSSTPAPARPPSSGLPDTGWTFPSVIHWHT